MQERLQKIIARAGVTSRRKAEELIVRGLVSVNGRVVTLGSIAKGPTASIATNSLRRDNLTGGAFFISKIAKQFVTRLRLTWER